MGEKPFLLSFFLSFRPSESDATCARVDVTGRVEKKRGSDPTPPQTKGADGRSSSVLGWGGVRRHMRRSAVPSHGVHSSPPV